MLTLADREEISRCLAAHMQQKDIAATIGRNPVGGVAGDRPARRPPGIPGTPRQYRRGKVPETPEMPEDRCGPAAERTCGLRSAESPVAAADLGQAVL